LLECEDEFSIVKPLSVSAKPDSGGVIY